MARWWPTQDQRAAYRVLAQVPPTASLSVQDRYVPHLSLRRVVTVFPTGLDRAEYVLVNEEAYPWHGLADVKLERDADAATIATAAGCSGIAWPRRPDPTSCSTDPDASPLLDGAAAWR